MILANDARIVKLQSELIAACTERDRAAHVAQLQAVSDAAGSAALSARKAAEDARAALDTAITNEAAAAARVAEAEQAVARARSELDKAEHVGTPDEETEARAKVDGLERTLQQRQQADALAASQRKQAEQFVLRFGQAQAEAENAAAVAQQAVAEPGRIPVSEATLNVIGAWYSSLPRPAGLPELDKDEAGSRKYRMHQAWLQAPEPYRPVPGDFRDPRIISKV